jgi:hypothetical protein
MLMNQVSIGDPTNNLIIQMFFLKRKYDQQLYFRTDATYKAIGHTFFSGRGTACFSCHSPLINHFVQGLGIQMNVESCESSSCALLTDVW